MIYAVYDTHRESIQRFVELLVSSPRIIAANNLLFCPQVVMAFEDEFAVEIPDAEAEKIHTVAAAVEYLSSHPQAK